MTLSEFKAWFEGFTETLDGPPNAKQWQRIQDRIGEIVNPPSPVVINNASLSWPSRPYPYPYYSDTGRTYALQAEAQKGYDVTKELGRVEAKERI